MNYLLQIHAGNVKWKFFRQDINHGVNCSHMQHRAKENAN